MNPQDLVRFHRAIVDSWPNTPFHQAEADVWLDAVKHRDANVVFDALRQLVVSCDFRPRLAALLELLYEGPSAGEVAAECRDAIARFGYHREADALTALSSAGAKAVEAFGGWTDWCCASDDIDTLERMAGICANIVRREARQLVELPSVVKRLELEP